MSDRATLSAMTPYVSSGMRAAYDEVIEGRDRVNLRPQADLARALAGGPDDQAGALFVLRLKRGFDPLG